MSDAAHPRNGRPAAAHPHAPATNLTGPPLTPQSKRLREAAKLTKRSWRTKMGRFIVEGPQAVREALIHQATNKPHRATVGVEDGQTRPRPTGAILDVWATSEAAERHPDILEHAKAANIPIREATSAALAELTDTVTSQDIVAIVEHIDTELPQAITKDSKLVVVLSQVRDPGNAGTVLRVADAAGADSVIFTNSSVDVYNPKTVRATAGSLFHLPVVTGVGLPEVVELARARWLQVLAADAHPPAHDLHVPWDTGLDLSQPTTWVFGNEAWGLPEKDRKQADSAVAIPLYGQAESLNLATAAAVCLYESARNHNYT